MAQAPRQSDGGGTHLPPGEDFSPKPGHSKSAQFEAFLERQILNGTFAPGEKLPPERLMANAYGLSRNTVRTAVAHLEKLQYVSRRWGSGTIVLGPRAYALRMQQKLPEDKFEIVDASELRSIIEPGIAALSAIKATEADLVMLEQIIDGTNVHVSPTESLRTDMEFHLSIARSTGNSLMVSLLGYANEATRNARLVSHSTLHAREESLMGHRRIYRAIKDHDANEAERQMRNHLRVIETLSISAPPHRHDV